MIPSRPRKSRHKSAPHVPQQKERFEKNDAYHTPIQRQTKWKEERTPSPARHRITVTTHTSFEEPLRVEQDSDSYEDDNSSYSSYYSQPLGIHQDMPPGGGTSYRDPEFRPISIGGDYRKQELEPNMFGTSSWAKPIEEGILRNSTSRLGNAQHVLLGGNVNVAERRHDRRLKQDPLTKTRRSARLPRSVEEENGKNRNLYRQNQRFDEKATEIDISTLQAAEARKNRLASHRSKRTGATTSTPVSEVRNMRKARLQNWR